METLEDIRKANDELRTSLKGGRWAMTPEVYELDPQLRGRLFQRITLYNKFPEDCDHSEGVVIFAGYSIFWDIRFIEGQRTLTVYLGADLLAQAH